jgi:hypothetical protein
VPYPIFGVRESSDPVQGSGDVLTVVHGLMHVGERCLDESGRAENPLATLCSPFALAGTWARVYQLFILYTNS